jgi:hypothetical protein
LRQDRIQLQALEALDHKDVIQSVTMIPGVRVSFSQSADHIDQGEMNQHAGRRQICRIVIEAAEPSLSSCRRLVQNEIPEAVRKAQVQQEKGQKVVSAVQNIVIHRLDRFGGDENKKDSHISANTESHCHDQKQIGQQEKNDVLLKESFVAVRERDKAVVAKQKVSQEQVIYDLIANVQRQVDPEDRPV